MPYYHVYIRYLNKKGEKDSIIGFNRTKEEVREDVAIPYKKNIAFLFAGIPLHRENIMKIDVFKSDKTFKELVLPNGKPILDADNNYIANCMKRREVKGVHADTRKFITLLEEKKTRGTPTKPLDKKEKVFIVHGRDEEQALRLQKYLTRTLKVYAEMFEDFKERSGSNTIIEQLEYIKDNVGYAFVIVTPDDLGCLREDIDKCRTTMLVGKRSITVKSVCEILDSLLTRARQNVVFEHGLFIGALGRDRVCCLLQKDVKEKPSDIDGILYVGFKKSVKETFTEIAQKLKKAGLIKT